MNRLKEDFVAYPVGSQVTYDTNGFGVGKIFMEDGVKVISHHPSYPGRPPIFLEMKKEQRYPIVNLQEIGNGHGLIHKFNFKVKKYAVPTGICMDSVARLAPGNGSTVRLGYNGTKSCWYVYVCVPSGGITATSAFELLTPLDDKVHSFEMAIRHNKIALRFDANEHVIPYTVDKDWISPEQVFWNVKLYSTDTFAICYYNLDFQVNNLLKGE